MGKEATPLMEPHEVTPLRRVARLVERYAGLAFPPEKEAELERGLAAAAEACGVGDPAAFTGGLLAAPPPSGWLEALVEHLTVGETYFFREDATFSILGKRLIPEILDRKRASDPGGLTFWSASCSTGEEPYSLAVLLEEVVPSPGPPRGRILATDINRRALEQARLGQYREWSFRGTKPEWRRQHFRNSEGPLWQILPRLRDLVDFHPYNLTEPAPLPAGWASVRFDVIFCRNTLMYFSRGAAAEIVARLVQRMAPHGVLALGASEAALASHAGLVVQDAEHCWIFRPGIPPSSRLRTLVAPLPFAAAPPASFSPGPEIRGDKKVAPLSDRLATPTRTPVPSAPAQAAEEAPQVLFAAGRYLEALAGMESGVGPALSAAETHLLAARCLANLGRRPEALDRADLALREGKLSPSLHFLRAGILEEMGRSGEAEAALKRCLFLDPDFAAAHFALGNLCRGQGRVREARKHYENTLAILDLAAPTALIAEPGLDLTAGRLAEVIREILRNLVQPEHRGM